MRRFLGHLIWGVSLGVLLATAGAGEAMAGPSYQIDITIVDTTTNTTNPTSVILWTSPNNTANPSNPNLIVVSAAFSTASTGVSLTGLQASTTTTATSTSLNLQGTATLVGTTSDNYTVTVTAFNNGYTTPAANTLGVLSQSESGTYTFTTGGNSQTQSQTFISWYNSANPSTPTLSGPTPGLQTIGIPTASSSTLSGSQNVPGSTTFSPYITPYALTSTLTLHITGTGNANNSIVGFQGSATLMAVPEPASLVMMLTGMPVPLMVLGVLRRRKAQRKTDLVA
jgi:hypothetical protein